MIEREKPDEDAANTDEIVRDMLKAGGRLFFSMYYLPPDQFIALPDQVARAYEQAQGVFVVESAR